MKNNLLLKSAYFMLIVGLILTVLNTYRAYETIYIINDHSLFTHITLDFLFAVGTVVISLKIIKSIKKEREDDIITIGNNFNG